MRNIPFNSFTVALCLCLNATSGLAAPAPYQSAVLTDKPLVYYSFEEASGTVAKNDGTKGASVNGTYAPGPAKGESGPRPPDFPGFASDNRGASFNGTSDFVDTGLPILDGVATFTIELWVKEPSAQAGTRIGFAGQNDAIEYGLISPTQVQIWTPSGGSLNTAWSFPANTWHHVVSVGDGNELRTYYDGELVGTGGTATASYGSSAFNVHIGGGGVYDGTGNFFRGQLDEVAIYDTALSVERIRAHYAAAFVSAGDVTPPAVAEASGSAKFTTATLVFTEAVDGATAGNKADYSLDGGLTVSDVKVINLKTVSLTTSKQTSGTKYTVTVKNVKDLAGNATAPDTKAVFTAYVPVRGILYFESYLNISGTPVDGLLSDPKYPDSPDEVGYLVGNFDTRTIYGNDSHDNYGARVSGFFVPPTTGDYRFYLRSDDASQLFLSSDETPANGRMIAEQTGCCNAWNTTQASEPIPLQAGKKYYMEGLLKEGGGNDWLRVAVKGPGENLDVAPLMADPNVHSLRVDPASIPWNMMESYFDPDGATLDITGQPQNATVVEGTTTTLAVAAAAKPKPSTRLAALGVAYQWQRADTGSSGFKDIPGANLASYTTPRLPLADNGAKYRVTVITAGKTVNSAEAAITVTPDKTPPTLLGAQAKPTLTEVILTFSERIDQASATTVANYKISSASGSLSVSAAALSADATKVTLTTAKQTLGTKYTVTVDNVTDAIATPNKIAAGSKTAFFPVGKIVQDANGFVVFEAENFDRNLDGLWLPDTTRGDPSGGISMVNPNGAGGSETATKLEYDVEFKRTGSHIVWYRASANDGGDDSGWFHLDGDRPAERAASNDASMDISEGSQNFAWMSNAQSGPDPFTVEIATAGLHVIGLARREDGAYYDKFVITTNPAYVPTGFGPPETREGAPPPPTITISAPTEGQNFSVGATVTISVSPKTATDLAVSRVEFMANGAKIGESTTSPFSFTWTAGKEGLYRLTAVVTDEVSGVGTSQAVSVTVGTPPPQALYVAAGGGPNGADNAIVARLQSQGWQVRVVGDTPSQTPDANGMNLIIVSSTVGSGNVGGKFTAVPVPLINWEEALQDNLLLTTDEANVTRASTAGQDAITIVKADHPLAAGLSAGAKTIVTSAQTFSWGVPAASASLVAAMADDPTHGAIYAYDTGATLIDGVTKAPARRVHFLLTNDTFPNLNADGVKLFDAAVKWAANLPERVAAPTLSLARTATGITLTFTGTLQSAGAVTGPWSDVANAKSPFAAAVASGARFYRVKQ